MARERSMLAVKVRRCHQPGEAARWETFTTPRIDEMTVADVLVALNAAGRMANGQATSPIVWSSACTWPACGSCAILINGRAAPACGTTVGAAVPKRGKLVLAPMAGFVVRRDLWVDRDRMRADAARAEAFVDRSMDANHDALAAFSACTRCGACVDACPEAHPSAAFIGPYALGAMHATKLSSGVLPSSILAAGGIADCGHVQNCVEICPERLPLDRAINATSRAGWATWARNLFKKKRSS